MNCPHNCLFGVHYEMFQVCEGCKIKRYCAVETEINNNERLRIFVAALMAVGMAKLVAFEQAKLWLNGVRDSRVNIDTFRVINVLREVVR